MLESGMVNSNALINMHPKRLFTRLLFCLGLLLSCSACTAPPASPEHVQTYLRCMGVKQTSSVIVVNTSHQTLSLFQGNQLKKVYCISTSKRGIGQHYNSYKTPIGLHRINEKLGDQVPRYGVFNKRNYVGAVWHPRHPQLNPKKDFIVSRILRLEGMQPGLNQGTDRRGRVVDSDKRAIYIHGTTMEWKLGKPSTKGCVHMSSKDVIDLFQRVPVGTLVWITKNPDADVVSQINKRR